MAARSPFRVLLLAFAAALLLAPTAANAWNPNMHVFSGELARLDAIDDDHVTINGRPYAVPPEVVTALRDWPQFFHAGVVGPDGFPDVTYGQLVVHGKETGQWMGHVFKKAWEAQSDGSYSAAEKSQILAFAYGYMTHASGDMWAHTYVNDISDPSGTRGVYPPYGEILGSIDMAAIAARHLIFERSLADVVPGYDGNPDRGPAPGGDISDDSTPGTPFDAPHRWIYETFVNPEADTPQTPAVDGNSDSRGPVIGFFLDLRDGLQDVVNYDPDPIADAIDAYNETLEDLMDLKCACNFGSDAAVGCGNSCCPFDVSCADICDQAHDAVICAVECIDLGFTFIGDSFEAFLDLVAGATEELALLVVDAYLGAWIDDINDGLKEWGRVGLAFTRAANDPQTKRDLQNEECQYTGGESTVLRAQCEEGVGFVKVFLNQMDPYINDHLLSMIGLPDLVGDVREIVGDVMEVVEDVLGYLRIPFNPILEAYADIKQWITDKVIEFYSYVLGVDLEALAEFAKHPYRYVCINEIQIDLPILGVVTLPLFEEGTVDRTDEFLGLPPGSHVIADGLPEDCGRYVDSASLDVDRFTPFRNSTMMAKLLLLNGGSLDQLLTDELGRTITSYGPDDNIMVQALDGTTWLKMIDGDHAWRADGKPVFPSRDEELLAGHGQFPIWESCVLRNSFRKLFVDWENGTETFPDLGDGVSSDPANDPGPPVSALGRTGAFYDDGIHKFVAADNEFTHSAEDGPAGKAFPRDKLALQHRIYADGTTAGDFEATGQDAKFSLAGSDGLYTIDFRSEDCCHTFAADDGMDPEPTQSGAFVLDASPPVATCGTPPFGNVFDTDDLSAVSYTVSDGPLGSGVASQSAVLDGYITATGTTPVSNGSALDMFLLYPGVRTVTVTAADNLGNSGTAGQCTFEIKPTAAGLISSLDRAWGLGLIKGQGLFNSMRTKLDNAAAAAERGQCAVESNIMNALANEALGQSGKGVEKNFADRLAAWALYVSQAGDPACVNATPHQVAEQ